MDKKIDYLLIREVLQPGNAPVVQRCGTGNVPRFANSSAQKWWREWKKWSFSSEAKQQETATRSHLAKIDVN